MEEENLNNEMTKSELGNVCKELFFDTNSPYAGNVSMYLLAEDLSCNEYDFNKKFGVYDNDILYGYQDEIGSLENSYSTDGELSQ